MITNIKDYLTVENQRNEENTEAITTAIRVILGSQCDVMIGHHLTVRRPEWRFPIEVPSMDTFLFSHALMIALFATEERAIRVMQELAAVPSAARNKVFCELWEEFKADRDRHLPDTVPFDMSQHPGAALLGV